jgi:hypothetical protein
MTRHDPRPEPEAARETALQTAVCECQKEVELLHTADGYLIIGNVEAAAFLAQRASHLFTRCPVLDVHRSGGVA